MGQFYFRPEDDQWELIRSCSSDAFDAAIVQARYLAPYPVGHSRHESDPRELAHALNQFGAPWLIDLGTPGLCDPRIGRAEGWARLREAEFARSVGLPLEIDKFDDPDVLSAFVEAAVAFQVGAPARSAPYFEFDSEDDSRLKANLAMLRQVVGADRGAVGFVQIMLDGLNRGLPARVAARYAETKVARVFLRVRNLKTRQATQRQFADYLDAIAAFAAHEIEVVADQAGRFGAAAVGGGVVGFSGGAQFFSSVPRRIVAVGGGGGGMKLAVETGWTAITRDELPATFSCPVPNCPVAAGSRASNDLREHSLHYFRYLAGLAANRAALITELKASGQAEALGWAAELERRERLSA